MASKEDSVQWTTNPVFIKDVIRENQLPVLVKVSDGYCGDNEAESFSIGDLIKLDFIKCIQKVRAVILTHGSDKSDEIFIPLGYSGKVKIIKSTGISFHSVEELIKVFPKYVLVEKDFYSEPTHYHEKIHIKKGEHLELDRFIEEKGLVAKHMKTNKSVVISVSGKYHFVTEPDNNEYTIKDVIENYSLPQIVSFVGDEIQKIFTTSLEEALDNIHSFSGRLKLLGLSSEDVVVGHYKPLTTSEEEEKFVHRNIILLPTNRTIVKELEVYLPVEKDTEDYEMLLARNFSQDLNMSAVDGALYVEMAKNPKNMIQLSFTEENMFDKPPPKIPPRRKPEQSPEKPTHNTASDLSSKRYLNYEVLEKGHEEDPTEVYDEISNNESHLKHSHHKKSNKLYQSLKGFLKKAPAQTSTENKHNKKKVEEKKADDNFGEYEELDPFILGKIPRVSDQDKNSAIPVVVVKPTSRPLPNPPNVKNSRSKDIEEMTVSDLVDCLRFCKVEKLADLCEKEALDGDFVSTLTEDNLKAEPYCLDNMEVMKFQRIKKGWRPKK